MVPLVAVMTKGAGKKGEALMTTRVMGKEKKR
jgi:hypothetical protein